MCIRDRDTYAYDSEGAKTKREREVRAAERIFGLLPEDQGRYFRELWDEFEAYESADAKYAHLLDNFQPLLLNDASGGRSWSAVSYTHLSPQATDFENKKVYKKIVWILLGRT